MAGITLVGAQWGDEGKGKITDLIAYDMDYVVRFQGGNNAGHTVIHGERVLKLHLIPSGIMYPHITPVIANGCVIDPKVLLEEIDKLEAALLEKNDILSKVYGLPTYTVDEITEEYMAYAERIKPHIEDTSLVINKALDADQWVFFEGAQGTLLDLVHGTYPFVTSSSPTAGGACTGTGVGPKMIDRVLGIAKAYITRVGSGPFPTELFDETGELLQKVGGEWGTTTGRQRRCGS